MADGTFNIAKGRVNELLTRVKNNDPTNAALVVVLLGATGLVSDATMIDYDTLAAILAGASDELDNTGYARAVLTDADLAAITPDDVNDRQDASVPEISMGSIANDGSFGAIAKAVLCYDPDTTGGTDADLIPLTFHDFAITPDGSEVLIDAGVFFRAS